ncbi:MAG TPA: Gfo/Idh/MocA family oxidoreductase, partial [Armatimonadota bacterium]|nr:Gfo/Idh/MocA family oxidoreductase [Armatimonadota bacterium]
GTHLLRLALGFEGVEVPALCDTNDANLNRAIGVVKEARGNAPVGYSQSPTHYRRLLDRGDVDAVIVATPQQLHGAMCIDALNAGKHALSEVAAAMTMDDCMGLVEAERDSGKVYMLSENCCYYTQNLAVLNMSRAGVFGDITYSECGYVHDCRYLMFDGAGKLTWRGEMSRDYVGNLYPTHAIGPVCQWLGINRGDRLESLVASTTESKAIEHYVRERYGADSEQAKINFAVGDSTSTLIRTAKGVLIDLRFDIYSAHPLLSTTYLTLQGTTASYEDRKGQQEIWIDGRSEKVAWEPFSTYAAEHESDLWKQYREKAASSGHGGADFFAVQQFIEAASTGGPSPIPAADAAAWSCVIPLSWASIRAGGAPQEIPDFTNGAWKGETA